MSPWLGIILGIFIVSGAIIIGILAFLRIRKVDPGPEHQGDSHFTSNMTNFGGKEPDKYDSLSKGKQEDVDPDVIPHQSGK